MLDGIKYWGLLNIGGWTNGWELGPSNIWDNKYWRTLNIGILKYWDHQILGSSNIGIIKYCRSLNVARHNRNNILQYFREDNHLTRFRVPSSHICAVNPKDYLNPVLYTNPPSWDYCHDLERSTRGSSFQETCFHLTWDLFFPGGCGPRYPPPPPPPRSGIHVRTLPTVTV